LTAVVDVNVNDQVDVDDHGQSWRCHRRGFVANHETTGSTSPVGSRSSSTTTPTLAPEQGRGARLNLFDRQTFRGSTRIGSGRLVPATVTVDLDEDVDVDPAR
jgi:hypothetical protein